MYFFFLYNFYAIGVRAKKELRVYVYRGRVRQFDALNLYQSLVNLNSKMTNDHVVHI